MFAERAAALGAKPSIRPGEQHPFTWIAQPAFLGGPLAKLAHRRKAKPQGAVRPESSPRFQPIGRHGFFVDSL
jgi:hypothetical protein